MNIQNYNDMTIEVIDKTPISANIVQLALDLTQKKADDISEKQISERLAKYLLGAEHTSVFEHSSMTFLCKGISRSLLAQLTRQRTFKFTGASQHYQDYREYPMTLRPGWGGNAKVEILYEKALCKALDSYIKLIELGEKPEEARQVLPGACTVNLLITADPRNLAMFLRQRLCMRNVQEMQIFAERLRVICIHWFPQLFSHIGPQCYTGDCEQGKLSCGSYWLYKLV